MDRRRATAPRPASSEEVDLWADTAKSLSNLHATTSAPSSVETINRVNRLIRGWPAAQEDEATVPWDSVKSTHKRLNAGLGEIKAQAQQEIRAIDDAIEKLELLIALRQSPEEKRPKRPRGSSPSRSSTPVAQVAGSNPSVTRAGSAAAPGRGSVQPPAAKPKVRNLLAGQLPLAVGRKVAFRQPTVPVRTGEHGAVGGENDPDTWILAVVTQCVSPEKNRYMVQDAEPQEDGQPGQTYETTIRQIIPLPDPNAPSNSAMHPNSYPTFPSGSTVMALYPDTSCFYRAEVISTPKELAKTASKDIKGGKQQLAYVLKFEDDDDQEHAVAAQWVVEWPGA